MSGNTISRRKFLAAASTGAAVLSTSALPARAAGANERINIGSIGTGDRGNNHINDIGNLAQKHNVAITAVCDVWQVNLKNSAAHVAKLFGAEPRQFTRFGDMLALDDIDAVVIATPDVSHGPIMVEALKAGKDVYVEKPMTIQLSAANESLDLARKNERVVQVGTQYRSHQAVNGVAREVATGVLGKISRVSSAVGVNHARWARPFEDCKEADVDWDALLMHVPKQPFDPSLLRRWHLHREMTNGLAGLWMSHYVDAMHLMMGAKYPVSAVAHGGNFVWKDGREHCDTFHALIAYPEEFLFDWVMALANGADTHFGIYGLQGMISPEKGNMASPNWTISGAGGAGDGKIKEERKIEPIPMGSHMENWLECMRTRQRPRADIQFGHQHSVADIMSAEALHTGRRQKYDPDKREISAG